MKVLTFVGASSTVINDSFHLWNEIACDIARFWSGLACNIVRISTEAICQQSMTISRTICDATRTVSRTICDATRTVSRTICDSFGWIPFLGPLICLGGRVVSEVTCIASRVVSETVCIPNILFSDQSHFCPREFAPREIERRFLVIGHRGSPSKRAENTISSFAEALDVDGANSVELDLCITKDREVVLWHDWDPDSFVALARQVGNEEVMMYRPSVPNVGNPLRRRTSSLSLNEFRRNYGYIDNRTLRPADANIPLLSEFLSWAINQNRLQFVFLDIKIPKEEVSLVSVLRDNLNAFMANNNPNFKIVLMTPEVDVLKEMKRRMPIHVYSLDSEIPPGIILNPAKFSGVRKAIAHGNAFADVGRPYAIAAWTVYRKVIEFDIRLREDHNRNSPPSVAPVQKIISWTINDPKEMDCLISMGVHGIMTDKSNLLRSVALRLGKSVN